MKWIIEFKDGTTVECIEFNVYEEHIEVNLPWSDELYSTDEIVSITPLNSTP